MAHVVDEVGFQLVGAYSLVAGSGGLLLCVEEVAFLSLQVLVAFLKAFGQPLCFPAGAVKDYHKHQQGCQRHCHQHGAPAPVTPHFILALLFKPYVLRFYLVEVVNHF